MIQGFWTEFVRMLATSQPKPAKQQRQTNSITPFRSFETGRLRRRRSELLIAGLVKVDLTHAGLCTPRSHPLENAFRIFAHAAGATRLEDISDGVLERGRGRGLHIADPRCFGAAVH